jgi:hypothetical protein
VEDESGDEPNTRETVAEGYFTVVNTPEHPFFIEEPGVNLLRCPKHGTWLYRQKSKNSEERYIVALRRGRLRLQPFAPISGDQFVDVELFQLSPDIGVATETLAIIPVSNLCFLG